MGSSHASPPCQSTGAPGGSVTRSPRSSRSAWSRVLAGARSFVSIGEVAADLPQDVLARLGAKFHPDRQCYIAPSEPTIRRHLQSVDPDQLDTVVGSWLYDQSATVHTGDSGLVGIAVDGKALRGARQEDDRRAFLFAGMLHTTGAVVAQREVDTKSNEIVRPERRVMTM